MSPTISVRALSQSGEPMYGNGTASFLTDLDACAQLIRQTLLLLQSEWWMNTSIGTPLFQNLLSHPIMNQAVALIIQDIILGVPYVTGIMALSVTYVPQARRFSVAATVTTQFGPVTVAVPMIQQSAPSEYLSLSALTNQQLSALTNQQLQIVQN